MTRIIALTSGKGGVGKTFLTANLAYALAQLGEEVVAIDANLSTPHLGLHLGMQLAPVTLHDVLRGSNLKDALYSHPFGFKVLPGSLNLMDLQNVDVGKLPEIVLNLLGRWDYILLDSAPGLGRESISSISSAQEVLIVATPDMPSVLDASKIARLATSIHKKVVGIVLNRVGRKSFELSKEKVEEITGYSVLVEIPEDSNVLKSISMRRPLLEIYPDSSASSEVKRLAYMLEGIPFKEKRKFSLTLIDSLVSWMLK